MGIQSDVRLTIAAFLWRDFHVATSYRLNFLFQIGSGFFLVATFFFVSKLINSEQAGPALQRYETDYFTFVLIGLATTGFLHTGLGLSERLRTAMTEGSLQMMLASSPHPAWIIVMPLAWDFLFEGLKAGAIILIGLLLFNADLREANVLSSLVVLVAALLSFTVFGLLSTAIIILVKRGDPIHWAFEHAAALVAGAYFPVELLPNWLEKVSAVLPMTYAYEGIRKSLLVGATVPEVGRELAVLVGFSALGLPFAVRFAKMGIDRAKMKGSLGFF
jgi:ABC-2 type transport system permease protein